MRKIIVLFTFIISVLLLGSCSRKVEEAGKLISVKYAGENYVIDTPKDLEYFVKQSSGIPDLILMNVAILDQQDAQGTYKAVTATALDLSRDQHYMIHIPLFSKSAEAPNSYLIYEANCVMTCGSDSADGYCQQTIFERCKNQACNCTKTGESAMIFPD